MKKKKKHVFLLLSMSLLSLLTGCQKEHLTCNYASADISTKEKEHVVLAGFAARHGLSTGIHLPLKTHCLVIAKGDEKVCIVSNDLMEVSPREADRMRNEIANRAGIPVDHVLLHCIHTHSAPRMGGPSAVEGGTNYNYATRTLQTVIDCAVRTILDDKGFRPFRLEIGKGATSINGNRCEQQGPVDRNVYVARFTDRQGEPIVSIVNLACHPVCMGPASLLVSPDYAGVAAKALSAAWGGDVMQLTGASGNMDPAHGPKTVEYAEEAGRLLADSLKNIDFTPVREHNLLRVVNGVAELPFRIDSVTPEAVAAHADEIAAWDTEVSGTWKRDVRNWEQEILARFEESGITSRLPFLMTAVNVNGIVFFFSQGEPFVEYQQELRAAFPEKTIFFAGYTNGQNSYLPSAHAFEYRKGYEYEIDQMHVYIKAPYPLSDQMPACYAQTVRNTVEQALAE